MGIQHNLLEAAERRPNHVAWSWVERGRSLAYGAAVEQVDRMAGALGDLGVRRGDRVGVFAHSGLDYVVTLFGAWRAGAVAAVVDVDAEAAPFAAFLAQTRPTVLVYTHDRFAAVDASRGLVRRHVCMDGPQDGALGLGGVLAEASDPAPHEGGDGDPALVTTDGSYRVGALLDAAGKVVRRLDLHGDDVLLGAAPLWGVAHTAASLLPALAVGASAAVSSRWSSADGWDAAERLGATVLTLTPDQAARFAAECGARGKVPGSLRAVQVVDGPVPVDVPSELGVAVVAGPVVERSR
jgi:acyl-coenzyme A synthetase/AMP-(fatty) acid ligase